MFTAAIMGSIAVALAGYLWWGFTVLPAERWQFVASMPERKNEEGGWHGINFTWYGLLTANAYLVAVAVLLVLLGSLGVSPTAIALLALTMLSCCVPASRLVARVVEKKAHTFTVGGAVFVGIIVTPFAIVALNRLVGPQIGFSIPVMAACAAMAIAYSFGEGLGRLACVSFGCCYGRPIAHDGDLVDRVFRGWGFRFSGSTKKIAYAGNLEAVEVIPVQAITAVLYTGCGLVASTLFLYGHHNAAFLLATTVTQGWRSVSELMRADYRGEGRVSAYQVMGIIGLVYAVALTLFLRQEPVVPAQIGHGLRQLWQPGLILFLQGVWLAIFYYTGRSTVTGATLNFHVRCDRI